MTAAPDLLATLHRVLLVGFLSVTLLLLLVTAVNRLRVAYPVLSWRPRQPSGALLWPTVFVGVVLALLALASLVGQPIRAEIFAGYLLGGACWFAAAWLSTSVVVTEHGIVRNINRTTETVAWGQVVDYFVRAGEGEKEEGLARYVFFFMDGKSGRGRFELLVPVAEEKRFQRVVSAKLDARFEFSMRQAYGKKALEG